MFLTDQKVADRYGIRRPSVWRWVHTNPTFPRPVSLSAGCTRWRLADLEKWEADQAARGEKVK